MSDVVCYALGSEMVMDLEKLEFIKNLDGFVGITPQMPFMSIIFKTKFQAIKGKRKCAKKKIAVGKITEIYVPNHSEEDFKVQYMMNAEAEIGHRYENKIKSMQSEIKRLETANKSLKGTFNSIKQDKEKAISIKNKEIMKLNKEILRLEHVVDDLKKEIRKRDDSNGEKSCVN